MENVFVPPAFSSAFSGSTTQLATADGWTAAAQAPPMHFWQLLHSLSSPQAGGRQMS
jgi:hypothetical protein